MSRFIEITLERTEKKLVININHIAKIFDRFDRRIMMSDGTDYALTGKSYDELMKKVNEE